MRTSSSPAPQRRSVDAVGTWKRMRRLKRDERDADIAEGIAVLNELDTRFRRMRTRARRRKAG